MRHLGIDYGTKKIGLALTDEKGVMAFPHAVISNDAQLMQRIKKIIFEYEVRTIVVGHSLHIDGTANNVQHAIEQFIQDLTLATGLPIHLEPEQYSTKEAERVQGKNDMTDASAATIILNSYLNKQNNL